LQNGKVGQSHKDEQGQAEAKEEEPEGCLQPKWLGGNREEGRDARAYEQSDTC